MTIEIIMGKSEKDKKSDENIKQRFGKYFILDHLVDGGMAKIYRARFLGEEADKVIAIKMIKTQFSKDPNFKKMFLDELNVIFGFEHPNVVNTFDYGMNKGQLYVAMEYCDGKSVYDYIRKLKKKNCHIPMDIAVSIASQVCRGLYYVHKFRDKLTGKKKDIIHRDISPHNIMLGYEGAVKVIDFGIAKVNADSKANSDATQSGTIKGKISYLAPEYIEGSELDHRYDQFATGITLWEMLCGRKLFTASNNMAILKKIQQCEVPPPSSVNPNVPKELDDIVLKSLSRERKNRYENMDKFDRVLAKFLNTHYPDFHSSDVGYFAENLFKDEIENDRKKLFEFGKIDIKPYVEALKKEQKGGGRVSGNSTNPTNPTGSLSDSLKTRREIAVFDFEDNDKRYVKTDEAYNDKLFTSASLENVSIKIKRAVQEKEKRDAESKIVRERRINEDEKRKRDLKRDYEWARGHAKRGTPDDSKRNAQESENNHQGNGLKWMKIAAGVAIVGFVFWGMSGKKNLQRFFNDKTSGRHAASLKSGDMAKYQATLTLENFNRFEQSLFVNGKKMEADIHLNVKVDAREEIVVRIESKNKKPYVTKLNLSVGERRQLDIPEQKKEKFAQLIASGAKCPRGKLHFSLYGENRTVSVPSRGSYSFPLRGDGDVMISERGFAIYELTFKGESGLTKKNLYRIFAYAGAGQFVRQAKAVTKIWLSYCFCCLKIFRFLMFIILIISEAVSSIALSVTLNVGQRLFSLKIFSAHSSSLSTEWVSA